MIDCCLYHVGFIYDEYKSKKIEQMCLNISVVHATNYHFKQGHLSHVWGAWYISSTGQLLTNCLLEILGFESSKATSERYFQMGWWRRRCYYHKYIRCIDSPDLMRDDNTYGQFLCRISCFSNVFLYYLVFHVYIIMWSLLFFSWKWEKINL